MKQETFISVLTKMLGADITGADCKTTDLTGGTVGDVRHISGTAETSEGKKLDYNLVLKIQRKWERFGDPGSWRREYDFYASNFRETFTDSLRWPECYHAEMNENGDEWQLWLEYADGVSGLDLSGEMYECAAYELGRFQGRLYAEKPNILSELPNLSRPENFKNFYLHYKSWHEVYDYIRSDDCGLPRHLCQMLIDFDTNSEEIFSRIEKLPVILCHRDFWVTNIFFKDNKIILIDWDTSGWGYMGEDIASLIADEADVENMLEYYKRCVPAYYRGFSEHADTPHIADNCIREMILANLGYRLVEWYKFAESPESKILHLDTLQKIYEMKDIKL